MRVYAKDMVEPMVVRREFLAKTLAPYRYYIIILCSMAYYISLADPVHFVTR